MVVESISIESEVLITFTLPLDPAHMNEDILKVIGLDLLVL